MLAQFDIQVSMSGNGNCFDNSPMESFWGILKQELIHHRHYRSRQEARQEITEYNELFYNRQRIQANLGHLSPVGYALQYYDGLLAS
jgi:putative transposase